MADQDIEKTADNSVPFEAAKSPVVYFERSRSSMMFKTSPSNRIHLVFFDQNGVETDGHLLTPDEADGLKTFLNSHIA